MGVLVDSDDDELFAGDDWLSDSDEVDSDEGGVSVSE